MKRLQNELADWVNRGVDRHVRLAVTGLSRSGKTAMITSLVNQLLNVNSGARLPLFSAAREKRLFGVKRIAQRDFSIPRFAYDEGIAQIYGEPPQWPSSTRGVSEIRLKLNYRSDHSFLRHFKESGSLYVEIVDYPGEWLLDLPMLDQSYLEWSLQMNQLQKGEKSRWQLLAEQCDPFAPADETQLAAIASAYTEELQQRKAAGRHFIQPGRFVLPGELDGAPVLQFFPWPLTEQSDLKSLEATDKKSTFGMLKQRYDYYCDHVVKRFYKDHFQGFDRQIVLVDCLQPLNQGPEAFHDMRLALTQLMRSFHYGKRTLFRRLFSPCIDKLLFAASKADHITPDQQGNLVSLLKQLVQEAGNTAAFEGICVDYMGLAAIQATENGMVDYNGGKMPALKGHRLSDGKAMMFYPGDVPKRLPDADFWATQPFEFENFRPRSLPLDEPLPHSRLDSALEFLLGDKLK